MPCYHTAAATSTWGEGMRSESCGGITAERPVVRDEMGNHIPAMAVVKDKPSPALPPSPAPQNSGATL